MGGPWERIIGIIKRIMDAMLLDTHGAQLTHEVCAIINSRLIVPISSDVELPLIFTRVALLMQTMTNLWNNCQTSVLRTCTAPRGSLYRIWWRSFGPSVEGNTCKVSSAEGSGRTSVPTPKEVALCWSETENFRGTTDRWEECYTFFQVKTA